MPKLPCKCGYIHDLTPIPDDGWLTIRDKVYEVVIDAEFDRNRLGKAQPDTNEFDTLCEKDRLVGDALGLLYECPKCNRLMWKKPGENDYISYTIENDE